MTDKGVERLAAELRGWAEHPTTLSPTAARTRVLAHLPAPARRPVWRLAGGAVLAVSALVLILGVGVLWVGRRHEPASLPPPPAAEPQQQTIVHQLSSGTQLYIVVQPYRLGDDS